MSKFTDGLKQDTEELKRRVKAIKPARWVILAILLVVTVLSYVFYGFFFGERNMWAPSFIDKEGVEWTVNAEGEKVLFTPPTDIDLVNQICRYVPAVVKCIQSITILLIVVTILSLIAYKVFGKTKRGHTIYSLVKSLLNWITVLVMIVLILAIFGVDTTALITGAGVVTLVIGLGMQSLIADIVAGLFIIFENAFNVGDIITVDGFRGEVVEIGIRTTKLKALGNIKIFNNNSIQGVLNQSVEPSVAKTLIDVEYGDKIPEIEKIIKAHVSELNVPGALSPVSYDGVAELGASGVTLQFTCQCNEADIFPVGRALNGAVKNMFDENGIGIPFPQVVVHNGDAPTKR